MNDWIKHDGGTCPVPEGTLVDVKFRGCPIEDVSNRGIASRAECFDWNHDGNNLDIIAYRICEADKPTLKISLHNPKAKVPTYATDGAGGFDLYAVQGGSVVSTMVFDTGVAFEIPKGKALLILSRSGHGFNKDVRLSNAVGLLDSDFRGTAKVKLRADGEHILTVAPGDRIAQGVIVDAPQYNFMVVEDLSETERGEGGFGSSGS